MNLRVSTAGIALVDSPPFSTSSPLRKVECSVSAVNHTAQEEESEEGEGVELNVDGVSINSAVINELFDCVLEQSDDTPSCSGHGGEEGEEDDEEDALNISSMSLLTPLAETVASVIRSPERSVMMVRWSVAV